MSRILDEFNYLPMPSGKKISSGWSIPKKLVRLSTHSGCQCAATVKTGKSNLKLGPENTLISYEVLSVDSDADYRAAIGADKAEILGRIASKSIVPAEVASKDAIQTQWGSAEEPRPSSTDTKFKPKKRVEADSTLDTKLVSMSISKRILSQAPTPPILVKSRTIDTLSMMFPLSSGASESQPAMKAIDWNVFVRAMSDAGFLARHTGGSAVVLEKQIADDADDEKGRGGRIVFHKPHPVAKIDPVMFHCMGRRMEKCFGWGRGVLAVRSE